MFKNHGEKGGTSILHSHTQIVGMGRVPELVLDESKKGFKKKCLYCDMIKKEKRSKRLCFENKTMVAIAPYASRFNYETWIFPKKHIQNMNEMSEDNIRDMAEILRKVLRKLRRMDIPYNFYLHYAPVGKKLHMHIEVVPRKATWAGFEHGSGMIINSVSPELAAEYYRS